MVTASPTRNALLVGSVALITLAAFENIAVTTVMPVVLSTLGGVELYALAMGLPLAAHVLATAGGGIWVDARSLRGPLLAGVAAFAAGLAVAGAAPDMGVVAAGRGVSGLGSGLMVVSLYAAVGRLAAPADQPRYFAAFSVAWVIPGLVGPVIAGYLAQHASWRWVFLGVVPFVAAAAIPVFALVRAVPAPEHPAAVVSRMRRTLLPAALVAVGIAMLQSDVVATPWLAAAGLVLVIAFLPRLLPPGTFALRRGVPAVIATRLLLNGVVIAIESYLTLYLQRERGWEPGPAGLVLTVGSVTWALGSIYQGRVTDPQRRHRVAVAGAVMVALGTAVTAVVLIPGVPAATAVVGWTVAGMGIGMTFASMAVLALRFTPVERHGEISSALQIADGAGAVLAIALFGATFNTLLDTAVNPYAPGFLAMVALAVLAVVAVSRVPKLTAATRPSAPATH